MTMNSFMCCFGIQNRVIIQKFQRKSRDENPLSNADSRSGRNKSGRSQSAASKSVGVQKKGNPQILADLKEQQV